MERKVKMPDDNQSTTNSSVSDPSNSGAGTSTDSSADAIVSGADSNFTIPSLDDLEYATPSAYVDPNLPQAPDTKNTSQEELEEPQGEEPQATQEDESDAKMTPEQITEATKMSDGVMAKVAEKIASASNILIALSSDPSIDELSAAIALQLFLDRLGKHVIAIFSGSIPETIQFLKPEGIFENSTDALQDFVISLSKDKADHLRYKLEGDFVKVFITPYKNRISAEDLEFSYGNYNVDLCLAINVDNGVDIDPALRDYGQIIHGTTVINITTGNPGKFGEIEWSNRRASSVSEMIANLFLNSTGETKLNEKESTALLAGIIAATDRFARANTFSNTLETASRLLELGADQQLVAANISEDLDNQFFASSKAASKAKEDSAATTTSTTTSPDTSLSSLESSKSTKDDKKEVEPEEQTETEPGIEISHEESEAEPSETKTPTEPTSPEPTPAPDESSASTGSVNIPVPESSDLLNPKPNIPSSTIPESELTSEPTTPTPIIPRPTEDPGMLDELKATEASLSNVGAETTIPAPTDQPISISNSGVIEPINSFATGEPADATSKYGQMLEDALAEPTTAEAAPMANGLPPVENPAASIAPEVSTTPETSNMPEINYGENSNDQILPPPPAPPIDINAPMPMPAPVDPNAAPTLPPMPEPTPATAPNAPDAFTIPGV
ncbi:MAG: hypothetical protein Q4A36_00210 [Candidatus Saccharibacteria bacterium]|nr:hypothetical protein [Candidatus Saccharibacteria bacterium]